MKNPTVDKWVKEIQPSIAQRRAAMPDMQKAANLYRGDFLGYMGLAQDEKGDRVWTNHVYSTIKAKVATLFWRNPHVLCQPRKGATIKTARLVESIGNYLWSELKLKKRIKRVVQNALIFGTGWVKFAWDPELPSGAWVRRYAPWRVHFDPTIEDFEDLTWLAFEMEETPERIKDIYRQEISGAAATVLRPTEGFDYARKKQLEFVSDEKLTEKTKLYEIHDREAQQVMLLCEGHDRWLKKPTKSAYTDLEQFFPALPLSLNIDVERIEGLSEALLLAPHEEALQRIRVFQLRHLARANRKYETEEQNITIEGERALKSGEDGAIVTVKQIGKLRPIPDASIPQDFYMVEPRVKEDIRNTSGMPDYRRGAGQLDPETASAVVAMERGADVISVADRDEVEQFCADLTRNLIQLYQMFSTRDRLAPIAEREDIVGWREWGKRDIAGEYDFITEIGSTIRKDERQRKQEALELYNGVKDDPNVNRVELLKYLFQTYRLPQTENFLVAATPLPEEEGELGGPPMELPEAMEGMEDMEDMEDMRRFRQGVMTRAEF
uniref:Putative head tail connector protein n=1 Tax=viral metagenome TaxID=1070528 RepID=A0A6H1ZKJ3_9ZZZZ